MYRTPVKEVPALSHDAAIPGPSEVGAAHARVHSESGDNARSKTGNMSCRSRRSISSRKSVVSETVSQIRALELENQLEKEELEASLRVDQIRAQQKLEELKIQKDLEMQLEKKKSEFQRRRIEREIQINELKSVSRSSIHSSPDRRVRSWVEDIPDGHEQPNPPPRFDPPVDRGSGQTEVVTQALKALQYRAVRDLPQFNGNLMEWPIFENEFNISTVEFALSSQDNLRRLNKALHGKARQCVEALLTSAENVNQIMKLLKTNFGRTEWIVSNRLDMLRNLETVREGNIESFRTFFNAVTGTAVALKNVNAEMYLMNPELIAHLADKLPTFSKQMWIRHKASLTRENKMITFDIFSGWLEDELDNQLASVNPTFLSRRQAPVQRVRPPVFQVSNTATDSRSQCPLCSSEEHPGLKQCEKFLKMSIEQRRSTVRGCKACYLCLEVDHSRRNCKSNKTCSICKNNHHQLVHPGNDSKQPVLTVGGTCNTIVGCNTILRVGKVRIRSKTKTEEVFALFDEGSSLTMLDSSIAKEMDLQGTVSPISYRWTNGITHTDDTSMIISLQISGPSDQAVWHKMNNVRTIKNMKLSQMNFDLAQIRHLYPLLDEEKLKVIENATPRMLIGSNNAGLIVPLKTIQYLIRGLQLTRCHLGWTVHGEIQPVAECIEIPHVLLCSIEDMELTDLIKTMYAVDNFGMTTQSPKMAEEDTRAVDIMNRTIKCIGDRYEVGQLYKFNHFTFPDSKPQALRRLKVMEKKMDADPEFADQYCNKIEDYLQKGYARKLTGPELLETPNTWYLPHFSVCSAKKFRLVMDAKAKSNGFSLNDLLLKGPDLVPPLIAVLMRGRRNKIAFMADIQEMFHQVRFRPEDQNSQRFFWRGMERKKAPDVYVMQAMIFGAVSSPCIAQYIKNFNANRLDEALPGVREAALCQHYVDDYFDCRDTEGEAIQLINNVIEAHRQGGFKLVKFVSNSKAVMKSIDSSLKADEKECRVLGLKWDLRSDEFMFPLKFSNLPTSKVITKRQLLKFMMSIFDPLGVLGPITIHLKILFQDLWRLQIDWDDDIPDGLMTNWNGWLEQIGIDYFGPLTVKVGRRTEKRWVALFTCLSSRALHLEVVPSLDTSSCLIAIRCFMSIRGIPQKILTDNGTNFVGADRETKKLLQELDLQQIADTLSVRGVQWAFIPPGAPHFGGCWERLVRSVKTALRSMLKDRHPSDLVLRTALCEVMNVVNNRPLTHVPEDPQDPEPITPNMILLGRNNHMQYDHDFDERDLNCRAAYKHAQIYADRFWRKWVSSYRPELLKRHKWQDNRNRHEYAVGDLVMIVDENMHRGCWPKGIIDKVMRGTDGNVRTVSVRTAFSSYVRPVTKIIVLQPRASGAPEDVADNEMGS
ncbi:uncharacterized protein LOC129752795 [Uranotaenia lowii]|uniref:uncharacterized protein LOC129752795 n=1 Tax=Uranotaenia lowii TaxID=190385 RepID=UPI00247A8163|nr:uncharacterized protein LOC129752795 [Uranotaenia lowii]